MSRWLSALKAPNMIARWVAWGGALLGALGWWLPWVLHPKGAAALVLLGLDLGEFFKFTSLWRAGAFRLEREVFFVPPVAASLTVSLLAARAPLRRRAVAVLVAGLLALVILPEYERWGALGTPEYQAQGLLAAVGLAGAALVLFAGPRLPLRLLRGSITGVALAGALLPLWGFWRLELILEWLYGTAIVWGPGIWVSLLGFLTVVVGVWGSDRNLFAPFLTHR